MLVQWKEQFGICYLYIVQQSIHKYDINAQEHMQVAALRKAQKQNQYVAISDP